MEFMVLSFCIDNQDTRAAEVLGGLLAHCRSLISVSEGDKTKL
jgi:hypothetical protein